MARPRTDEAGSNRCHRALGCKNKLFLGSEQAGPRAAGRSRSSPFKRGSEKRLANLRANLGPHRIRVVDRL